MKPISVVSPRHTFFDLGSALCLVFRALAAFQVSQLSNCLSVFLSALCPLALRRYRQHTRAKAGGGQQCYFH